MTPDIKALVEQLRALSRHEHDDLSIGDDAADALERLAGELEYAISKRHEAIESDRAITRALALSTEYVCPQCGRRVEPHRCEHRSEF